MKYICRYLDNKLKYQRIHIDLDNVSPILFRLQQASKKAKKRVFEGLYTNKNVISLLYTQLYIISKDTT